MASLTGLALIVGLDRDVVEQAGWTVTLRLPFLPVYMLLIMIAVLIFAAWRRAGWWAGGRPAR